MNSAVRDLQTLFDAGSFGGLSDARLLERFVERRESAVFEALLQRHGPMVWGVCRRVLRNHHDAEDAFQATFHVFARKAASIMMREKLSNWLYGVAYQTATKARTMRAKRRVRESQVLEIQEPIMVPNELRDAVSESLDGELSRLPEKYRIPIVLCELEGRTLKEAASQLGWPVGTVSSRLSRARSLLASRLARRGVSLSVGALTVLLAQESASASVPVRLIGSTARAAHLVAAGGAVTAGVVPAKVAALTGEVLKMMSLGKLKIVAAMLLAASAVAAGGTGLAFQEAINERGSGTQGAENRRAENQDQAAAQPAAGAEQPGNDARGTAPSPSQGVTRFPANEKRGANMPPAPPVPPTATMPLTSQDLKAYSLARPHTAGQEQGTKDSLMDALLSGAHTPQQLDRAKKMIEAMLALEKDARSKSAEELDKMIEEGYWGIRVMEAEIAMLKKIRDTKPEKK